MFEQNNPENLKQIIDHIVKFTHIIEDQNFDETATKQFIVLPILRALGWDDRNLETLEVFPEFRTGNGKVDYALQNEGKPLVFVECKRWSTSIEAEKPQDQIALYIFQEGVDLGVATNGRKWDFYLAYKTHVPWKNRKFCSIELNNQQETVANFQKYLSKVKVIDGSAKAEAEKNVPEYLLDTQLDAKPPPLEGSEMLSREDT